MSNLDKYISKLLVDNKALEMFINDPKGQSNANGLSKADGAILRRSVHALPATAKSGLSIKRPLSSYRSSIRLLQNVLHNHHGNQLAVANNGTPTIQIYYNDVIPNWQGAPVNDPHQAYVASVYVKSAVSSPATVGEAMGFKAIHSPNKGDTVTGTLQMVNSTDTISYVATYDPMGENGPLMPYITQFKIGSITIDIPVDGVKGTDRAAFWFYSINGAAIVPNTSNPDFYHKNPDVPTGGNFISFEDYPLTQTAGGVHNITWQAIAPDMDYGFAPCFSSQFTPTVLGVPYKQESITGSGQVFYNNIVYFMIEQKATKWLLAENPDGTGNLSTDDFVGIEIYDDKGTFIEELYSYDYSNNCSGKITPTGSIDVTSVLQAYKGKKINIKTYYQDKCGAYISSSGYFLVQQ